MPEESEDYEKRLSRLERRAERERSAREQAERIAEDGMRRLFLANQELDDRVAERTAELETERRHAARTAGERAEFLRLLSREARSPLNGVIGVMEVLDDAAESEQTRAWIADGLESAKMLDSLMTRLLLFLELEDDHPNEMTLEDPAGIVSAVSARWKHEALRAGLLLSTENQCPSNVFALVHISDLNLILDELVSNAVKYGDPGLLRICAIAGPGLEDGQPTIEFVVEDPGPGIEHTEPLLDASFHDWDNTAARGMGYSLIARLAHRTGAAVDIESGVGSPTTVRVTLPALHEPQQS